MGDFPFRNPDEARYDGPTLIIRGTKSHYVADDVLPVIGRFFPRFQLRDIECGHWVISEKPEDFKQCEWFPPNTFYAAIDCLAAVVDFLQQKHET